MENPTHSTLRPVLWVLGVLNNLKRLLDRLHQHIAYYCSHNEDCKALHAPPVSLNVNLLRQLPAIVVCRQRIVYATLRVDCLLVDDILN